MFRYFFILSLVATAAGEPIGFNSHIRPLLSDHCFACHGFDPGSREADLRLDTPEGAFEDRKSGAGIIAGEPEKSLIWKRISSNDPDDVMPPAEHHLKLDAEEKKLIYRWIKEGAKYQEHWTFIPVEKPELPNLAPHPVDALVKQKLQTLQLDLSVRASRETLIRRLSFDLRGLPPTPEEVSTFLNDESPKSWERLVDQFLADQAFGERFAWPWLDAARYADSNGFQNDGERTMWPWRDWVVEAINRNLPYDDFTVWQIAGDLLPNATHEQKLATGFLRNHAINGEGGSIPEENRVNYVFDMTETVGTVWMGLTFNCCRCHDHKYDPLSQRDYYSLTSFFNQTPVNGGGGNPQTPPILASASKGQLDQKKSLEVQINQTQSELEKLSSKHLPLQKEWEKSQLEKGDSSIWKPFRFTSQTTSDKGLVLSTLPDQSLLATGANPAKATFTLTTPVPVEPVNVIRLDALRHPSMTLGGIARSNSGNFVLTSVEIYLHQKGQARKQLMIRDPQATFEQGELKIGQTIDQDRATGWAVLNNNQIDRDHAAIFPLAEPLTPLPNSHLEIVLRHDSRHAQHYLGHFRLSHNSNPSAKLTDHTSPILALLKIADDSRSKEQKDTIEKAFLAAQPEYTKLSKKITSLREQIARIEKAAPKVMIMADRKEHRPTYILSVGSYQARGEEVTANTPGILPPLPESENPNRLDLAKWLVSRNHPLTSRVTVNRLWQDLFGIGLIKSPEDFGVQSEIPVHPELLDWLAADFMDNGWDFKKLVKIIVTSEVYRQSSKVDSLALERDPENRLLARAPRYRLPSWMIRDQALAHSGQLVREIGGEPVKPWQPKGLWSEVTFGKKTYVPDSGEKTRRRTLYTFWRRISAPPMIFDNAKRESCEVGTYRTNSPLHALSTLNDPLYLEASRGIAYRAHTMNSQSPVQAAFKLITCRQPTPEELPILSSMYENSRTYFGNHPEELRAVLETGDLPISDQIEPLTQAALTSVILSLLNTDEALTKE